MPGLVTDTQSVTVTVNRWRRFGKDRLYVADEGQRLGWHDLITGATVVEAAGREGEVHAAVAAYLPAQRTFSTATPRRTEQQSAPPTTDSPPDEGVNLSERTAGQLARERADAEWEAAKRKSKLRAYAGRLVGTHTSERAWRIGADGEQVVGRALERLPPGWTTLHAVPVGDRGSDIDHVVVGPAGLFTINAKHHPDHRIAVYPNAVYVSGQSVPYLRNSRHEAKRATRLLSAAVGWPVPVTPVLVFVNAREVTVAKGGPVDVIIVARKLVKALTSRARLLGEDQVADLAAVARQGSTWTQ